MKLSEIYEIADALAPKRLSDRYCAEFGAYDNSGVLLDCGEEITGIVFSLDLSFAAIEKALQTGANLIFTHHPAIYGKIDHARFDADDFTEQKLVKCLRNGISVLSMHLNLDCAPGGIDESLAQGIARSAGGDVGTYTRMQDFESCGYGRVYDVPEISLGELVKNVEERFSSKRITFYGDAEKRVRRAASFCGAGADGAAVLFAKENGADVLISADFKHHVLTMAAESGLAVIAMTHYASENYGFEKYYEKICRRVTVPCVFHTDEYLL